MDWWENLHRFSHFSQEILVFPVRFSLNHSNDLMSPLDEEPSPFLSQCGEHIRDSKQTSAEVTSWTHTKHPKTYCSKIISQKNGSTFRIDTSNPKIHHSRRLWSWGVQQKTSGTLRCPADNLGSPGQKQRWQDTGREASVSSHGPWASPQMPSLDFMRWHLMWRSFSGFLGQKFRHFVLWSFPARHGGPLVIIHWKIVFSTISIQRAIGGTPYGHGFTPIWIFRKTSRGRFQPPWASVSARPSKSWMPNSAGHPSELTWCLCLRIPWDFCMAFGWLWTFLGDFPYGFWIVLDSFGWFLTVLDDFW